MQDRWTLSRSLSPQSLIVPGKSPTRKKSGPFGSRRSSAIGIENIQEVQEKRWVSGSLTHQRAQCANPPPTVTFRDTSAPPHPGSQGHSACWLTLTCRGTQPTSPPWPVPALCLR